MAIYENQPSEPFGCKLRCRVASYQEKIPQAWQRGKGESPLCTVWAFAWSLHSGHNRILSWRRGWLSRKVLIASFGLVRLLHTRTRAMAANTLPKATTLPEAMKPTWTNETHDGVRLGSNGGAGAGKEGGPAGGG